MPEEKDVDEMGWATDDAYVTCFWQERLEQQSLAAWEPDGLAIVPVYPRYDYIPSQGTDQRDQRTERVAHDYMVRVGKLPKPLPHIDHKTDCKALVKVLRQHSCKPHVEMASGFVGREEAMKALARAAASSAELLVVLKGHGSGAANLRAGCRATVTIGPGNWNEPEHGRAIMELLASVLASKGMLRGISQGSVGDDAWAALQKERGNSPAHAWKHPPKLSCSRGWVADASTTPGLLSIKKLRKLLRRTRDLNAFEVTVRSLDEDDDRLIEILEAARADLHTASRNGRAVHGFETDFATVFTESNVLPDKHDTPEACPLEDGARPQFRNGFRLSPAERGMFC
eukprot:gene4813-34569_t